MKDAHLWKRILNEGLYSPDSSAANINQLERAIITAPLIVDRRPIEGVGNGEPFLEQYKFLTFPFDTFWVEGVLPDHTPYGAMARVDREPPELPHEVGWKTEHPESFIVRIVGIAGYTDRPVFTVGQTVFPCSRDGRPLANPMNYVGPTFIEVNGQEKAQTFTLAMGFLVCDVLTLLGCKNVSLEPRDNNPKQVRRAVKRHGGTPDSYRYHVLVVRPAGSKPGTPGVEVGTMPRHVCRGHFAEYGPEFGKGLLFGKYAGRFFIPPHMKGDKKNGVVEKDYAVVSA